MVSTGGPRRKTFLWRGEPTHNIQKGSFGDPSGNRGCRSQYLDELSLRMEG